MKEAQFYKKLKENTVQCQLCPHYCSLKEGEIGKCKVRKNIRGTLYSLSYEHPVALNVDPVEKKPLYNYLPGVRTFSIGMAGCNLSCKHCQNSDMSQKSPEELPSSRVNAEEIVRQAKEMGCPIIAYTYSEPLVSYEYMLDIAKLAKKQGIKNVIVSNGFINPQPLKELCKHIDAANIDLKSMNNEFYEKICEARLAPVLESLKMLKQEGVWLEITNLIIPTLNDTEEDITKLIDWTLNNLGGKTPIHFTAFYPQHKLSHLPLTLPIILKKARKIALEKGIKYVYTGNVVDEEGNHTYCPKCGSLLIKRSLFSTTENNIKEGKCFSCNEKIEGVWN